MSCGTPVIAVNSTANPELISDKKGYICEVGDVVDIKRKIDLINTSLPNRFATLCREYVKSKFEMNNQMEKYIAFYKELLN